jgi:hypothetical protein
MRGQVAYAGLRHLEKLFDRFKVACHRVDIAHAEHWNRGGACGQGNWTETQRAFLALPGFACCF